MVVSLLMGLGCMIVSLLGLKCIKIGSATEQSKAKIAVTGGILANLSGEFGLITIGLLLLYYYYYALSKIKYPNSVIQQGFAF